MKSTRIILAGALALALLASCTEEPDESYFAKTATLSCESALFTADQTGGSIVFGAEGGTVAINVECGADWEVLEEGGDWVYANVNLSSGTLTVSAAQSIVGSELTETLTLRTSGEGVRFATINVSQSAYDHPTIGADDVSWHAPAAGALSTTISVDASGDWSVQSVSETWLTAVNVDGMLNLTAAENEQTEGREAEVVLVCTDGVTSDTITLSVYQDARAYITVDNETLTFPAEGGSESLAVDANFDWTCTATENWIGLTVSGGAVTVTVQANENTDDLEGTVTFTTGDGAENTAEVLVSVIQSKADVYLTLSTESLAFGKEGGQSTVEVKSNYNWKYATDETWFTLSASGDVLTVTAAENETYDAREGVVTFTAGDGAENTVEATLTVTQEAAINPALMVFELTIESFNDGTWTGSASIPIYGTVNCTVDWGDGSDPETVTSNQPTHAYTSPGVYHVSVDGTVTQLNSNTWSGGSFYKPYITALLSWGTTGLTSLENAFRGLENLKSVPVDTEGSLSEVTTLKYAFYNCGIEEILPGTFDYCDKVTNASYLFYWNSTDSESSLKTVPAGAFDHFSAVTDVSYMFYGTTALESLPDDLFKNCGKVTTITYIFYKAGLKTLTKGLFNGLSAAKTTTYIFTSSSLESIEEGAFDVFTVATLFTNAFQNCKSLTSIPSNLFKNCSATTNIGSLFSGCSSLKEVPENIFNGLSGVTANAQNLFYECTSLETLPEGLLKGLDKVTNIAKSFYNCTSLKTLPEKLFEGTASTLTNASYLFYGCSALESVPAGLFDDMTKLTNVSSLFYNCTGLACESPYTVIDGEKVHLYERSSYTDYFSNPNTHTSCFYNCTGLTDWEEIQNQSKWY